MDILFQDQWIIAVNKPPGLPAHPTMDPTRPSVVSELQKQLQLSYTALHHRLDRDTSGVMLFVIDQAANKGMSDAFQNRKVQKVYKAICFSQKPLPQAWPVDNHLGEVGKRGKKMLMGAVRSGGDHARSMFRTESSAACQVPNGWVSLVSAKPETGRTHQIRVHLSQGGRPIVGDELYSPDAIRDLAPRLMLHAESLTFEHPIRHNGITITAPIPRDFQTCWNNLSETHGIRF